VGLVVKKGWKILSRSFFRYPVSVISYRDHFGITQNNVTALIENCRQAIYGYDQRLEAFGSAGMVRVENPLKTTARFLNGEGVHLSYRNIIPVIYKRAPPANYK
jgi:hypothetical protein